jgi:excisionase family DNA binding protein
VLVDPIRLSVGPDRPDWLTVAEAAEYVRLPESTLRKMIKSGAIPHTKPGGKQRSHIRIWSEHLDDLMRAGFREATSGPLANGDAS